jgi:predicted type IV restriction endonuclease
MARPAPDSVKRLVDHFDQNRDAYLSGSYNESQLRREFIDPLFEALGWDVENRQGSAMPYRDVIFEDSLKVGGATKAPDYCFRIGGMRKFFVEAKKPSVDIAADAGPAFQLRRYAWSAKLPLSILSDFEEFAVYDCRSRPVRTDKASTARIKLLRYSEYPDRWDELCSVFSPEAIRKGSFDKYVEDTKARKGTAEVDDAFLAEIEGWRDSLARNIALRNPRLGTPDNTADLNLAVQMTIDRAIFLRICEDRGIEDYGTLQNLIGKPGVYRRLMERFEDADKRYNSGLFDFRKDTVTPSLKIDDKLLSDILSELYPPKSPYEFSVIGIEILGEVYEQFLGKVIRLTAGHQAKVEEKPEVRRAGGVYYTPTYTVDCIVKNTVCKLVEGKTPAKVRGSITNDRQPRSALTRLA